MEKTRLLLPRGEWLGALLSAFAVADLEIQPTRPRSLEYTFVTQSLPIIFSVMRSWEVWPTIKDGRSAQAGFTGTDIVREQLARATWMVPLEQLNIKLPKPYLKLGVTPNITKNIKAPKLSDIAGTRLYTSYPNSAKLFLSKNNLQADVVYKQGAIEGFWRIDKDNGAIIDVVDTGKTMEDNEIRPLMNINQVERVALVQSEDMDDRDALRILDLRDRIERASRRMRS